MGLKFITLADGYKLGHKKMFDSLGRVESIYSNFTPRGSRIPGQEKVVLLGLQYLLQEYFTNVANSTFFNVPKTQVLEYYQRRLDSYLGSNDIGTEHIGALHDLGYIPLEFCAVPEGTHVKLKHPMFTIENTHPDFYWVTNYFETLISDVLWQPCTSATTAYRYKKILDKYVGLTGGNPALIPYLAHDFSMRGMNQPYGAAISGLGHLSSFIGSDTVCSIDVIEDYYTSKAQIAASVSASEHAVMTLLGQDGEFETFEKLIDGQPNGVLSLVADGFSFWRVIGDYLPRLKDKIMARNGTVVVRPDSGVPEDIICGDLAHHNIYARKGLTESLWDLFGGVTNRTGYKELDSHIGDIYGDAIQEITMETICQRLMAKGFAATNLAYGIGSFSYNYVTRDTHSFAIKATHGIVDGKERIIFKDPQTGSGKKSARGRIALMEVDGEVTMVDGLNMAEHTSLADQNLLKPVWRNGHFLKKYTWDEIRENVAKG
jgi:nicotinamide phosphoribosyltransferase